MSDRKARLAALAAKAGRNERPIDTGAKDAGNDQEVGDDAAASKKPTLSFRNYVPKDASLDATPATTTLVDDRGPSSSSKRQKTSGGGGDDANPEKSALETALLKTSRESREAAGQNVTNWSGITPVSNRKVNWDLKRDIRGRMDRLERRTQRAIVDLLRERLEREAGEGGGGGEDDSDLD
mmetsp:Transcript_354/g.810  ORF Transcript_354/g.810 Transcript_354/m.810 type:complete len:181 (-) Transcript_354:338-880(-)